MKMWLVGMMGSGKTSAGEMAAERLEVDFADTDTEVERRAGMSIPDLWSARGEAAFRRLETQVVADFEHRTGIVATGGGAVLNDRNRDVMTRSGTVVWLDAAPAALATRIGHPGERPLLSSSDNAPEALLTKTHTERIHLYTEVASSRIATDALDLNGVVDRIEQLWKS